MLVTKRNGSKEEFNPRKIETAIYKAFDAVYKKGASEKDKERISKFIKSFDEWSEKGLKVETIQNKVERYLCTHGYFKVGKAYMLYREQHKKLRANVERNLKFIENFVASDNTANATIDDNSNVATHNIAVMNTEIHKEDNKETNTRIWYNKIKELYDKELAEQFLVDINTILYPHDLSSQIGMPYCVAITLYPFLLNGIKDIGGLSAAPKNIDSFCGLFVNLVFAIAAQYKGACMHHSQNLIINGKTVNIKEFVDKQINWLPFKSEGQLWEVSSLETPYYITEEKRQVQINKVYRRKYDGVMYKVTTKLGKQCIVTKDHIFKTLYKGSIKEVKAEELSLYDTVFINNNLSNIVDRDSVEYKRNFCLGMLLGDGCLTTEALVQLSVCYDHEFYLDTFNEYSSEVFGFTLNKNKGHHCWNAQKRSAEYKDKICSYLTGSTTLDKNIKPEYLQSINEYCGFLDGIMSTDGSYHHCYAISLINKGLIDSCIKALTFLSVPYHTSIEPAHDNKKELYNLSFSSCAKVYLPNFLKKCKKHKGSDFTYYISNKAKKWTYGDLDFVDTSRRGGNKWGKTSELDVITSIETFENDYPYVYELETESHWYSCGGIITHNCATPGMLLCMDYFLRKEWGDNYYEKSETIITSEHCLRQMTIQKQIHQYFQQICYSLMQPSGSRGNQACFWNLSIFDKPFFDTMYGDFYFPDGTQPKWESLSWLQKDFMHWFNQERLKCILTFPVVSVCLIYQDHKFLDEDLYNFAAQEYAEGDSFFTYISDSADSLSSCCRLSSKMSKPQFNFTNGQLSEMTGSKNVITLNLNRIIQDWYLAECKKNNIDITEIKGAKADVGESLAFTLNVEDNYSSLKEYMNGILDRVYKYQTAYNEILKYLFEKNLLTVYNAGFINMKKQYLTIGINGLNQAAEFLGIQCTKNEAYENLCKNIFSTIKEQNTAHKTKELMFNTEFTPCESAAIKLYNRDKKDNYWVPSDTNLYASYIFKPNDTEITVLDKLHLHGKEVCGDNLDGGSAAHINLDSHLDKEQYLKIIKYAAEEGCKYFTFNIPNSECEDCGFITKHPITECPKCGSKHISYYDRVIGYLTKISNWSKGRQTEQKTRVYSKKEEAWMN